MRKLSLVLFTSFLAGCHTGLTPTKIPDSVTVIFQDAPEQSSTTRFGGSIRTPPDYTIAFMDTTLRPVYYTPRSMGYDTVVVPAPFGYAEVIHKNQAIDSQYYLLKAGDTVLFTYGKNLRPQLQSLTSEENTRLYNLLWDDPRAVQPVGYSTKAVMNNHFYQLVHKALTRPGKKPVREVLDWFNAYWIDLDSLRPIYTAWLADTRRKVDSLAADGSLSTVYADFFRRRIEPDSIHTLPASDSLMHYFSFFEDAVQHAYVHAPKDAKTTQVFDAAAVDTCLSQTMRNAVLHHLMTKIENGDYWAAYPDAVLQTYRGKYQQITGDTTFCFQLISKENIVINGYSTDMVLLGLEDKQYTYGDILARHKGKVIYVDLWASWCGPCCAEMPAAKKLREAYKGRDVVFLYLALRDGADAWRAAVRKCETDYLGENYRILNADDSKFLREIKCGKIPRLLIYDRDGKLADLDAPRAEEPEIRTLLDKYLAQQ